MKKYTLKDMVAGEILEGNYNIIKEEIKERKKNYKNIIIKKEKNNTYILTKGTEKKMKVKKLYNVKQFLEDLEAQGFDIFYTKGNDADNIKVYEDKKQVIYINYNYSYIDIIKK